MNKNEFFEQIYDDYKDKIYEFIFYKVSNKELAEDLTSDVFISVYKNLHRYDAEKSFITTWLYAIAYNRLKNYYKSRKNNVYSIECLIEMSNEIHIVKYDSSEQEELRLVLKNVMKELPERNRRIVLMKYYGNMTSREIGKCLDISPGNVRIILKRSLAMLKSKLS